MTQIYHPYWKWEDWKNGMWSKAESVFEELFLAIAIRFTGNHIEYGKSMLSVINEWKYSCEHNLSNTSMNRRAWIGHAACSFKYKIPEYIIRRAWWQLTEEQRNLADEQAENVITLWEQKKKSERTLRYGNKDVIQTGYQMKLQMN